MPDLPPTTALVTINVKTTCSYPIADRYVTEPRCPAPCCFCLHPTHLVSVQFAETQQTGAMWTRRKSKPVRQPIGPSLGSLHCRRSSGAGDLSQQHNVAVAFLALPILALSCVSDNCFFVHINSPSAGVMPMCHAPRGGEEIWTTISDRAVISFSCRIEDLPHLATRSDPLRTKQMESIKRLDRMQIE